MNIFNNNFNNRPTQNFRFFLDKIESLCAKKIGKFELPWLYLPVPVIFLIVFKYICTNLAVALHKRALKPHMKVRDRIQDPESSSSLTWLL